MPYERALAEKCADAMMAADNASRAMGMHIEEVAPGFAVLSMQVRSDMINGHDTCHGGIIFTLADSAFAFACNSYNQVSVAAAAEISFLKPALLDDVLTATSREIFRGGRNGIYDTRVTNQNGDVIAEFRGKSRTIKGTLVEEETP